MAILIPLLATILATLPAAVVGHGGIQNYTVGDIWYPGYDPNSPPEGQIGQPWMIQRAWGSINPIWTVDDPYLACNNPGTPPPSSIPIKAGQNITAITYYWLHSAGPMTVWMAPCGLDCSKVDVNTVGWFKIWEAGLLSGNLPEGMWYQKAFQRWDGSPCMWPVTIPRNLRPGRYMIRNEIISIHVAYSPQFYPECAHLQVSGSGTALPPADYLKNFPGVYDANDTSLNIDIYSQPDVTNYTIPGGPIWPGFVF